MTSPDRIRCDSCDTTTWADSDSPLSQAVDLRQQGWTTPTPFSDRCPTCSAGVDHDQP